MDERELVERLRRGNFANVPFNDFLALAGKFGFELERVSGSHHILRHLTIPARLNLQPLRRQAKPYQLRQFLSLVERYGLQWMQPDV